ncbi:hypothetical protein [Reyranella sp.]|uniref:hypothetical protein n=1 Tax=Reyranella sp. TaxID=1929291 RepID=UPI003BAB313F
MGDGSVRLVPPAASAAAKLSTLVVLGIALAASPPLAQSAMTPGAGAMAPQPRVAPAPQAPVAAPQAPVVAPQVPLVAPAPSGDRVIQTTNSIRTTGTPTGPAAPTPNYSNTSGIDVVVTKKPHGGSINIIDNTNITGNRQLTLKQLEPGNYDVALPNIPGGGTVSMTTFVNGTLASRSDFPAGSSVGTFAVSSAKDTVILKFETNLGATPVNGVGGTGGGRFQTNLGASPTNGVGGTGGGR